MDESDVTEITQYNNFSNFFQAFFVMIRCSPLSQCSVTVTLCDDSLCLLSLYNVCVSFFLSPPTTPFLSLPLSHPSPSFPSSIPPLTLLLLPLYPHRVVTGENWPSVMNSCLSGQPCQLSNATNCGNDFAYVFFPVFYILTTILVSSVNHPWPRVSRDFSVAPVVIS